MCVLTEALRNSIKFNVTPDHTQEVVHCQASILYQKQSTRKNNNLLVNETSTQVAKISSFD